MSTLRVVPPNPGPEFQRVGFCNDTELDCFTACEVEHCPHGKDIQLQAARHYDLDRRIISRAAHLLEHDPATDGPCDVA